VKIVIVLCLIIEAFFFGYSQGDITGYIKTRLDKLNLPGAQCAIVKNGELVWSGSFGFADVDKDRPVLNTTLFNLASISKLVTATAVMQLVEKGLLDLDQDINNYLPFKIRNPYFKDLPITVRALMTHTGSLIRNRSNIPDLIGAEDSPVSLKEYCFSAFCVDGKWFGNEGSYNFENSKPGQKMIYNDMNTAVLGLIVETVSRMEFRAYCRENIFTPLEMHRSTFSVDVLDREDAAIPYIFDETTKRQLSQGFYGYPEYPSGMLWSNVIEFSNFLSMYLNRGVFRGIKILSEESINRMFTIQNPRVDRQGGLIWYMSRNFDSGAFGHTGSDIGIKTVTFIVPGKNFGVMFFANGDKKNPGWDWDIYDEIVNRIKREAARL